MPIGNGPDCYNGNVPEEDEQVRLQDKVEKWFYDLDETYQRELLEPYYPDDSNLMSTTEMWNGLDWNDKWDIYTNEKDEIIDYD